MTIRIARGPRGVHSPFLVFYGSTSNSSSSTNGINLVSNIFATINVDDPDSVDVVDNYASIGAGSPVFDVLAAPYDEWEDLNGNTFASANDVVVYINNLVDEQTANIISRTSPPVGLSTTITQSVNVSFTHSVYQDGVSGYFWNSDGLPNGVSVVEGDRRKISGIITQTGSYLVDYEVASISGITTNTLTIDVV